MKNEKKDSLTIKIENTLTRVRDDSIQIGFRTLAASVLEIIVNEKQKNNSADKTLDHIENLLNIVLKK